MSTEIPAPPRRGAAAARGALALVAALVAALPVIAGATGHGSAASPCGSAEVVPTRSSSALACAHADEPPRGVDVTVPVSTSELRGRRGAGVKAYQAAQDLGVPMAAASNATSPSVTCDGDGTSGYRVQAMYVVEAGRTNRFSSLLPSFKLWAAGVDDVVNRSAALTGGVRNLRYVTEPGTGGSCEAKVLNVTVPAGATASFGATIGAVQAMGYADPTRKYMMWTDATNLCGIGLLYLSDNPSQGNPNNGSNPQYARIDQPCWGLGDGAGQHSVEAHEIVHTLGAVNQSAAHSTPSSHCWDESDTMCYADKGSHAMVQVCPPEREYLLDCGSDDYFSTFPDPGSYLDSHWNAASSRFLVGGGDGTGGGTAGAPTVLGATIGVNNPAVPGLVTQVEVAPVVPAGRSVTGIAWKAQRADCVFTDPTAAQTTVSCPAGASGSTTVTAVVSDSTGQTKTVKSPLTFVTRTARPVTLTTVVDGQDSGTASVCTSMSFPLSARAVDQATGLPIRGLPVSFTRTTAAMTRPAASGGATTLASGQATATATAAVPTSYAAKNAAGAVYAASTATALSAVPTRCAVTLTGATDTTDVYYGDKVTVTGRLTRELGGEAVGVSGATVPVRLGYTVGTQTRTLVLASPRTAADGSYSVVVKPTRAGTLSVALSASPGWDATTVDLGALDVRLPTTELSAATDRTDVGYGSTVRVTGQLTRTAAVTTGLAGATVTVKVMPAGARYAQTVGSGRTLADGTYAVPVPLRVSGAMTAVYAGAAGLPASSVDLGSVTAGQWSPTLTLAATRVATAYSLTGSVTRTYADTTEPGARVSLRLFFTPTSTGVPVNAGSLATTASGSFAAKVYPKVAGSYTVQTLKLAGYDNAASNPVGVNLG